jgi:hypothetical protein
MSVRNLYQSLEDRERVPKIRLDRRGRPRHGAAAYCASADLGQSQGQRRRGAHCAPLVCLP